MPARYPSADDIAEMRARDYDRSVIEEARELSKRRELLERIKLVIRDAFSGVRLDSGVGLWEAQALDDYADGATRAKYREKDEKHNWQMISVKDLNKCNSSLSFFDAEGMRFHWPAYLVADLDSAYNFGMAYCLTQCPGVQFALLNNPQADAVRQYLQFIEEEPDYALDREHIRRALEENWAE